MREGFEILGRHIAPGTRCAIELPLPPLYTHTPLTMRLHVVHGRRPGPRLLVCAAVHGDEINGVEIIRRLLAHRQLDRLRGTLIAVPVVNVYGLVAQSRYLPDRRDLNRSFPGSDHGSLAARIANAFLNEVVARCSHGIDLHTGAVHRTNLPQIRANLDDTEINRLARAFGVSVLLNGELPEGSLRQAADAVGVPILLYEAGEALRFDDLSVRLGVSGILNVMRALDMLPPTRKPRRGDARPFVAHGSSWVRAPASGILRSYAALGAYVDRDALLGIVADPFGDNESEVRAPAAGVVIGRTQIPLIHEGEALYHLARFKAPEAVASSLEIFQGEPSLGADFQPPGAEPDV
ncbi:succinylglutamate desuccinylase/aspartoacylase family protein [Acidihalobacter prosperus]|uniref:Deacylase n=1 Tax=Acidihalobacter prosperus TaxID=160660 RepID=A0A1A6C589_9GAMM|nr:succinylglutamate desuccinylase/aspartoacylase family protein [Acidihalobacter prosperus]OBS09736.1 putative deacylase [Acidihalobacter prosperus]